MPDSPRVLLATTNPHKIAELREILAGVPCTFVTPDDLSLDLAVAETGDTFEENAVLKALAYAEAARVPALADDSGLEVDALGGEPGVYSARWAGEGTPYPVRFRLLAERLAKAGAPPERWTARYRCAIALAQPAPGGLFQVVEGRLEGRLVAEPRGGGGFGYDPIFFVPSLGRTVAQMSAEEKHRISHRGEAARAALVPLTRMVAGSGG
ncbi:MAG TPA: RdgB/HAM1 family non-canonical purine NTP pyrophosphatase [Ktedonobacterales bacterium]